MMIDPTGETLAQRTARRAAEAPAREHYYQTWGYAKAEFPTAGSEAGYRQTLELLHGQAIMEDARRAC